ncbi:carbohydrate ABC transporter permease [Chelatococcus asaccharovorans]|uniref:carbohydrate ABC transporter permease n=1 Tax=Chelatococcus asaccharovorans TaxID=28210 RepID=UPI00224C7A0F|nr:sugar ABC transporter permease [Chelatococcus asaccharovorans]CAH1660912.1 Carbohydrate ABC transporter membrane protein 1 (CUT1 family) [Chelatococcus asaccharovorans]CAH1683627.1 Carbohydrate ABC transporter membrane protein 1 (CUT1 family) [Chelatococcus asaccharovorans]
MMAISTFSNQRALQKYNTRDTISAYALLGPSLVLLICLLIGPSLAVFAISVTNWQFGAQSFSFIGLQNFRELFDDRVFLSSLSNTFIYVAVVVPSVLGLGLFVALAIESRKEFQAFYRAVHFLPVMATLAAMAIAWEALLHPTIGLVTRLAVQLGLGNWNFLHDPRLVLATLCVIGVWQHLGYAMVLFLAGLKAIPSDLYQAAEIDGVDHPLDRLRYVTLPMLGPVIMFLLIVITLKALETFDTVAVLTQGGPENASELLLHTLYVESFQFFRTGYGAAMTVVFLLIVIAIIFLQAKVLDKRVHYS